MKYVTELNTENIGKMGQIDTYYTYWQIRFKITKNKALYQILLMLFTTYLSFLEEVFVVSDTINNTELKLKIKTQV